MLRLVVRRPEPRAKVLQPTGAWATAGKGAAFPSRIDERAQRTTNMRIAVQRVQDHGPRLRHREPLPQLGDPEGKFRIRRIGHLPAGIGAEGIGAFMASSTARLRSSSGSAASTAGAIGVPM